jgi:hypothetical protein
MHITQSNSTVIHNPPVMSHFMARICCALLHLVSRMGRKRASSRANAGSSAL